MRWVIIILLGFFLIGFSDADSLSATQTDFNIGGCNFDFGGESIGVATSECSRGDAEGHFYCDANMDSWITTEAGLGCSLGEDSYILGEDFCCPSGMFCNNTGGGEFRCDRRLENCFNMTTELDCRSIGCIWFELNGECVDSIKDYGCDIYNNEAECTADIYELGQIGIGTDLCGEYIECNDGTVYSIPEKDCSCSWYEDSPDGKQCQVRLIATQFSYNQDEEQEIFSCSNTYDLGECIDGNQDVTWYSNNSVMGGFGEFGGIVPEDCLDVLGCSDGSTNRSCGEPIVKLSGFSLFAIFISIFIIGTYYFYDRDRLC